MKDFRRVLQSAERAGYAVIRHEWGQEPGAVRQALAAAWERAVPGDRLYVLTRKTFGAKALLESLAADGLDCEMVGKGGDGERVIEIVRSDRTFSAAPPRHTVNFEIAGRRFELETGSALFSKDGLDDGTRTLLEAVIARRDRRGARIADFGAGWGAVAITLAAIYEGAHVHAFERDFASLAALRENARRFPSVIVVEADLSDPSFAARLSEKFDLVVSNPPFHAKTAERAAFLTNMRAALAPGGECAIVVQRHFAGRFRKTVAGIFSQIKETENDGFIVFWCAAGVPDAG